MVDDFRGRGGSPWGSPPGGGGNGSGRKGPTPPDVDEIIRSIQDKINKFMPGGAPKGGKPIIFGLVILLVIWALSGLYRVCLLYTSPSPRELSTARMPSSA